LSGYQQRRPLLGASIKGASAQILVSMLPRSEVERRSQSLPEAIRARFLSDWEELAEAAKEYRKRCEEQAGGTTTPTWSPAEAAPAPEGDVERWTSEQVAKALGVVPRRVGQLVAAGKLDGIKVGNMWLITAESVRDYQVTEMIRRRSA
jgi:excisionase family DNA binding protein